MLSTTEGGVPCQRLPRSVLDIAKHVFHAHGADATGRALFSRKITRGKLLDFFSAHPRCLVALEACGGAHHWARELRAMGHEVRLIPPAYVKPYVKRHKNDAVDAEAICEAAQRPSMRFVAVKTEAQQAAALVFRTRDLLVKQRTQLGNAIRGHVAEYGWVAPKGTAHLAMLADLLEGGEIGDTLPEAARPMFRDDGSTCWPGSTSGWRNWTRRSPGVPARTRSLAG